MPLLYGEGVNAFYRLQEEIVRSSSDESIFAWVDETLTQSGLFAPSPAVFASFGMVVPIQNSKIRRAPFSITNYGLAMEARLANTKVSAVDDHWNSYIMPLTCARDDDFLPLAVFLRRHGN